MTNINFTILILILIFSIFFCLLTFFKNEIVVIFNNLVSFKNNFNFNFNFSTNFYIFIIFLVIISLLLISFVLYDVKLFLDFNFCNLINTIKELINPSNNTLNSIFNTVEKYVNSNNNNNFTDSFMTLIKELNGIIQNMSMSQKIAYLHISGSFFILLSLFSIISIFYGDYLITKLNLENRFPKLAGFIQLRRKFQHFYILTDVIISSIILIIFIYINIIFFMI